MLSLTSNQRQTLKQQDTIFIFNRLSKLIILDTDENMKKTAPWQNIRELEGGHTL